MAGSAFYKQLQDFAQTTAIKAGKLLLKEQKTVTVAKKKDIRDVATTADLKSEALILNEINKKFPDHNIFSEEAGLTDKHSEYTWIVDPLDSTKEYLKGLPPFGVLITCETKDRIVAGCHYVPRTQELFVASHGNGAFEGKERLKLSQVKTLSESVIYSHLPNLKITASQAAPIWETLARLSQTAYRLRATCWDAIALCYIAKGAIDGYCLLFDKGPQWFDIAAGIIVLEEAGGTVTDMFGKPLKHQSLDKGLVASNGKIHEELIQLLNKP